MNHIKKLEIENAVLKETILEIRQYLTTDKFKWPENRVNVNDILNRISNIVLWDRGVDLDVKTETAHCSCCDAIFKKDDLDERHHCKECGDRIKDLFGRKT